MWKSQLALQVHSGISKASDFVITTKSLGFVLTRRVGDFLLRVLEKHFPINLNYFQRFSSCPPLLNLLDPIYVKKGTKWNQIPCNNLQYYLLLWKNGMSFVSEVGFTLARLACIAVWTRRNHREAIFTPLSRSRHDSSNPLNFLVPKSLNWEFPPLFGAGCVM